MAQKEEMGWARVWKICPEGDLIGITHVDASD